MVIAIMTAQDYVKKLQTAYEAAESVPFEESGEPGKFIARGWAKFEEYLSKNADKKNRKPTISVTIKIPQSYAARLRSTGRDWRARTNDYVIRGIKRRAFGKKIAQQSKFMKRKNLRSSLITTFVSNK